MEVRSGSREQGGGTSMKRVALGGGNQGGGGAGAAKPAGAGQGDWEKCGAGVCVHGQVHRCEQGGGAAKSSLGAVKTRVLK